MMIKLTNIDNEMTSKVIIMKKGILILALLIVAIILVSGCHDILHKEPEAVINTNAAYQNESDAVKAVTATYQPLRMNIWFNPGGNNPPGYQYWVFGDIRSDEAWKGGESGSDQIADYKVSHFTATPTNVAVGYAWNELYVGVHRANLVLDNIPNIDMDPGMKSRLLGEAKFLRAYYYFQLVNLFGKVPLILKSSLKSYDKSRAPIDSVYDQIDKDFEDAANILPASYSGADVGRATKGAAQSYLGKSYLYQQQFKKADQWFQKAINSGTYQMDPDYYHMFTIDGEHGPGSIFEVDHVYSAKFATGNVASGTARGSRGMYGWGFVNPTEEFVQSFEKSDPRLKQTVYANGDILPDGNIADVGNARAGYLCLKYYVLQSERQSNEQQVGKDELMMRLGKVLLWDAEASVHNGNIARATKLVNRVRARARASKPETVLPPYSSVTLQDVYHEELVEYGLEHERFFDLVRTGRAADVFHQFAKDPNNYHPNMSKGGNYKAGVSELVPIPQSEIDLSQGKLQQNKGY